MKTKRLRVKVKQFLMTGPKSTPEIIEHINTTTRHGTTTNQITNVLSKDKDIAKVGMVRRKGTKYGTYAICQWELKTFPEGDE